MIAALPDTFARGRVVKLRQSGKGKGNAVIEGFRAGTKVLWREDYERIDRGRTYFSDFDPFGDFACFLAPTSKTSIARR